MVKKIVLADFIEFIHVHLKVLGDSSLFIR